MKRLHVLTLVATVGGSLFAANAHAGDPPPEKAPPAKESPAKAKAAKSTIVAAREQILRVDFASLPKGELPFVSPGERPTAVPAKEKADEFYVEHPRYAYRNMEEDGIAAGPRYALVFPSKADADAQQNGFNDSSASLGRRCFSMQHNPDDGELEELAPSLSPQTSVTATTQPHQPTVNHLTSEEVVFGPGDGTSSGTATLNIAAAWVDGKTTGVRIIGRGSVPLRRIGTIADNLVVYAYRTELHVNFVMLAEKNTRDLQQVEGATISAGNGHIASSQSGCHARLRLAVGQSLAESMIVRLGVRLPPKEVETRAAIPATVELRADVPADFPQQFRSRPLQVGFSSTWMSQDTTPVITISHGWAGRERASF